MSEAEQQDTGLEAIIADEPQEEQGELPVDEVQEDKPLAFSREDWEQSFVDKAEAQGWTDFDDYVGNGGDPENWRPAREFVDRGVMIGELKGLRQQGAEQEKLNDNRIRNLNKLHEGQMEMTIRGLEEKRNDAIGRGETEEALGYIEEIDQTRDSLKQNVAPAEPEVTADDRAIQLDNMIKAEQPWIYGTGDKADYAQFMLKKEWDSGADPQTIMSNVAAKVDKMFPNVNHNRNLPPNTSTRPNGPRGKAAPLKLTMNDLTADERKLKGFFSNDKDFLQAVTDDRAS